MVTTVAGSGDVGDNHGGFRDGDALTEALFSSPTSVTLYYDWRRGPGQQGLVLLVSDTNNHKIRRIHNGTVTTLAGGDRGLADGWGMDARFDTPAGLAVTDTGVIFVADTLNFLIRKITPDGYVCTTLVQVSPSRGRLLASYSCTPPQRSCCAFLTCALLPCSVALSRYVSTLAGTTIRSPHEVAGAGCPEPCLDGVPGSADGPLREATFYYPYDVAIGPNNTVRVGLCLSVVMSPRT